MRCPLSGCLYKNITDFLLLVQKVPVIECFQGNFDLTQFDSRFFHLLALGDKRNWESTYATNFHTEINGTSSVFVTDCSHDNKIIYHKSTNDNNNNNNHNYNKIVKSDWL